MFSRRQACRILGASAAAAYCSQSLWAGRAAGEFRLCYILASSLYGTLPLESILPEVRKTGAEYIDLWPRHHADQREQMDQMGHERFAELLQQHGVKLGMTTRYDLGPFGLADELGVLHKFGGRVIVTGSSGPRNLSGNELKQAVRLFVEEMKPHVAAAEKLGITIAIENHGHALVCSPESIRYLAEFSPSNHLGIALAPYHLPQDPKLLAQLIEDLGPKLAHFYAWQYGRGCMEKLPKEQELEQMPGRGTLDFAPLLAALRRIDYSGWTEIFMHPVPRGIPIHPTAAQVTKEVICARDYLEKCIQPLA